MTVSVRVSRRTALHTAMTMKTMTTMMCAAMFMVMLIGPAHTQDVTVECTDTAQGTTLDMGPENMTQPFRIVWNYPHGVCLRLKYDFQLGRYHLDHNPGETFMGDNIALFYSHKAGQWPFIDFRKDNKVHYGGFPTTVNLTAHLAAQKAAIVRAETPRASGFSVIDMELWRPVLFSNWGRYLPYRRLFYQRVQEEHPELSIRDAKNFGNEKWLQGSLDLMVASIEAAKQVRPNEKWGYYGFPEGKTKVHNGKLERLWQAITAYYPSVYVKSFSKGVTATRTEIKEKVAEAFRVRAEYGNPEDAILPYTLVQHKGLGFFNGEWLKMEVRLPLEMGVDGIVLWASSAELRPAEIRCKEEDSFVHTVLGPLVRSELKRLTRCSRQLCAGRGRCVKKEYADEYPYLQSRGVPELVLETATPSDVEAVHMCSVEKEFRSGYVCQCYEGFAGHRCTDHYEV